MNLNYLIDFENMPHWKKLEGKLLNQHDLDFQKSYQKLGYYDIVEIAVNEDDQFLISKDQTQISHYSLFTNTKRTNLFTQEMSWKNYLERDFKSKDLLKTKTIMLGEFIDELKSLNSPATIKINPVKIKLDSTDKVFHLCEDYVFAPIFDGFTNKLMLTDPNEAKALLAIHPEDQNRFGIEFVFYMITNRDLPKDHEQRELLLKDRVKELAFMAPRVPIKRGSGSFLCVLLNLENEIEESAFIRSYKMFDEYSDILFVNSKLEIRTGELSNLPYNGEKIDTIFIPMINWQRNKINSLNIRH